MKSLKYIFPVIAFLVIPALVPAKAQSVVTVSGDIIRDGTWTADTVKVASDIIVTRGNTLTIEAGTYVKFMGHYEIRVRGILKAMGTEEDPVIFSAHDTNGFSDLGTTDGSWRGLHIANSYSTDTSWLNHCHLQYAKELETGVLNEWGGALTIERTSRVIVSDCRFSNNLSYIATAIHCHGFIEPVIRNCVFEHNHTEWGAIVYLYGASPLIQNNVFRENTSGNEEILIWEDRANPVIESNVFSGNTSRKGTLRCGTHCGGIISNNYIVNNHGQTVGGIYCHDYSNPRIINNIIANNNGCGISMRRGLAEIINNTICNNYSDLGGIHCISSNPQIYNTIIYGNGTFSPVTLTCEETDVFPDFYNCVIQGLKNYFMGSAAMFFNGKFENITSSNPRFEDPTPGNNPAYDAYAADWMPISSSYCVNGGHTNSGNFDLPGLDIYGNQRILHGEIDIGAAEKHIEKISVHGNILGNTKWIADTVFVVGNIIVPDNVTLTIPAGTIVLFTDYYNIRVEGTLLAEGEKNSMVKFTIADTTGFSAIDSDAGAWEGIFLNNYRYDGGVDGAMDDNPPSSFAYSIFEYSKKWDIDQDFRKFGGVFIIWNIPFVSFDNCVFRNNSAIHHGGALHFNISGVRIDSCEFHDNKSPYGGSLYFLNTTGSINNSRFHHNNGIDQAACIYAHYADLDIRHSIFSNNISHSEAAIYGAGSNLQLTNCIVSNNEGRSGGIGVEASTLNITNSNIINNKGTDWSGGLDFTGSKGTITNSIIRGNTLEGNLRQVNLNDDFSDPDFINCNIQGGSADFYIPQGNSFDGLYVDCIDADPEFTDPSGGTGFSFDGLNADWSILDISPNINAGKADTTGLGTGSHDFYSLARVNDALIDIGAAENQGSIPSLITQPEGKAMCTGDTISLVALAADTAIYQWQRDGEDISEEISSHLKLTPATLAHEGNYRCRIENSYDVVFSNSVFIPVKAPPVIQSGPQDQWVEAGSQVDLEIYTSGSVPFIYEWHKDDSVLTDAKAPVYTIRNADFSDEGGYITYVSNSCGTDSTDMATLYLASQICMVTVSPATGNNLVVWEKKSKAPVMAYNIYRESIAAGIYDLLATIPAAELSVFVDTVADPTVQAYLYKITALDDDDIETDIDLCSPHKTIHLIVSTNPELKTTQLQWDRYYGFDYQTYTIYKSTTGLNFDPVHSLSASLNSWTDPDAATGDLFYRIAVEKPDPCLPSGAGKKAGTGPYVHSLSNLDNNKLKEGQMPPDTILLSNNQVPVDNLPGFVIGKLTTVDLDSTDSHSYKFVPGAGDDDNQNFTIAGDLLMASVSFDQDMKTEYQIRIRTTDEAGNYIEVPFTIHILPVGLEALPAGDLQIYPNPVDRSATIRFPNPGLEPYTLTLTDLSGKVCRNIDGIRTSEYVLEKAGLEPGYYFIELAGPSVFRGQIIIR